MDALSKLLIGNDNNIERRNIIWNMIGSAVYAITSMLLGAAVTRIMGADIGGIFFFAFSTLGQQMFIVAYFGMRPIQVTDTGNRYSFGDYRRLRNYTSGVALIFTLIYIMVFVDVRLKAAVILLTVIYKLIDGYADCYESEFQRSGRLYLTGKSNTFRTLLSVIVFLVTLIISNDIIFACMAAVTGQIIGLWFFCIAPIGKLINIDFNIDKSSLINLFNAGKWLFFSTFLDLYIFASSKYAVDAYMEASASSYFSTIFIPTSVINLMAGFIIRPVLTKMSIYYEKKDISGLKIIIKKIIILILVFTIIGMVSAWIIGIPILGLMLGKQVGANLRPYTAALLLVIAGGGFYAILNLLYYVLVIIKEQRSIFVIYGIGTLVAYMLSGYFVRNFGIDGAAISYLLLMVLISGMFAGITIRLLREKTK